MSRPKNKRYNDDLPSVTLIVAGNQKLKYYPDDRIQVVNCPQDQSPFTFLNWAINNHDSEIYGIFSATHNFTSLNALSFILHKLWNVNLPEIGAVYTDYNSLDTKFRVMPMYLQSYASHSLPRNIVDTPVFCKKSALSNIALNEKLQHLYVYDIFVQMYRNVIMAHLPALLCSTKINHKNMQDIKKEFEIIHDKK